MANPGCHPWNSGADAGGAAAPVVVTLQEAYDNSVDPEIVLAASPGPLTIRDNATPVGNLLEVQDNAAADLLAVSPSGILATPPIIGDTAAGGELTLRGTSNANLGFINMNSPVKFGAYGANPSAAYGFDYSAIENLTSPFVGGGLNFSGNITFSNPTFIYESFRGAPTINTATNLGFAAYTVLQALPRFNAGAGAGHNPLAPLIVNCSPTVANSFSGTRTTSSIQGVYFVPTVLGGVSGAVMNITEIVGLNVAPKWNTVSGSTVNFGTVYGLKVASPAVSLFGGSAGTERMAAYYGVNVANPQINNGFGTMPCAALRSTILVGTNRHFLLNAGTAPSDMGAAHMYFDDNFGVAYGGAGIGNFDYWDSWNAAGGYQRKFFNSTASALRWSSPANNRFLFDNDGGNASGEYNINCYKFSLGAQTGNNGNQIGAFVAGARATTLAGEWADFINTSAANLTVDHALTLAVGWSVNAPSLTLGTGSVTNAGALSVGGNVTQGSVNRFGLRILSNPSGGSGVNAGLWVTAGLSRFDGRVDINNGIALGGGVAATLGTIGGSGPTAAAQAQWVEIDVNGTPHWIPVWA